MNESCHLISNKKSTLSFSNRKWIAVYESPLVPLPYNRKEYSTVNKSRLHWSLLEYDGKNCWWPYTERAKPRLHISPYCCHIYTLAFLLFLFSHIARQSRVCCPFEIRSSQWRTGAQSPTLLTIRTDAPARSHVHIAASIHPIPAALTVVFQSH